MLADDEPIMRKALLTLTDWESLGCEVVYTAANGQEVMERLKSTAPDILVTDIRMPGKDGIELAKYIWEQKLPVKVIILTAYADFSYAQSAVKYGVVDYVTKTGAFDGLIAAVEKAQDEIQESQRNAASGDQGMEVRHLLKSVFDGSMYEEGEIQEDFQRMGIDLGAYLVLVLQFRMGEERERKGVKAMYKSLENFFAMAFAGHLVQALPVERDMFAIVLSDMPDNYINMVKRQCGQIVDMMDNFMQLYAYIGVGNRHETVTELKAAYEEAQRAMGYSFITEENKVHFFCEQRGEDEVYSNEVERQMEKVCAEVGKGNEEEVRRLFLELTQMQKNCHCSQHVIKNSGIFLQGRCRRILAEYDKTIYEVTGLKESISRTIYKCRHMDEYEALMYRILTGTARKVHIAVNKKESLVHECLRYIEENYSGNIMVTDIARSIGVSASYLSRIFKEHTGQTIIYTLNQKKLCKAKEYLKNTDMKIYEIAEALGFENVTYFSHFFKKYEGISPKDYKGE